MRMKSGNARTDSDLFRGNAKGTDDGAFLFVLTNFLIALAYRVFMPRSSPPRQSASIAGRR